jgi:predicted metal-binding transcription factor (methanogenesis marker protein 9)
MASEALNNKGSATILIIPVFLPHTILRNKPNQLILQPKIRSKGTLREVGHSHCLGHKLWCPDHDSFKITLYRDQDLMKVQSGTLRRSQYSFGTLYLGESVQI